MYLQQANHFFFIFLNLIFNSNIIKVNFGYFVC